MEVIKKELPHFNIGSSYGGNQEWFDGFMMRVGGCAAETACDLCIYLDLYMGTSLYPYDKNNISKSDYIKFGSVMKPYLHPRMSGIDKLPIYLDGFGQYLADRGNSHITLSGVQGSAGYSTAEKALISQLDGGIPVPFLLLKHTEPRFKDYEWHWFLLNGYIKSDTNLMVKAVTYSEYEWLDFYELWHTGMDNKGGMITVEISG